MIVFQPEIVADSEQPCCTDGVCGSAFEHAMLTAMLEPIQ